MRLSGNVNAPGTYTLNDLRNGFTLAERGVRVNMESGGYSPVIMCDDVDPVATAATSVRGKSRNAGQACVSTARFFVEDRIYDSFTTAFAEKAAAIQAGNLPINRFVASRAEIRFGGAKRSGIGREGGVDGLRCYTVVKNVSHLIARPFWTGQARRSPVRQSAGASDRTLFRAARCLRAAVALSASIALYCLTTARPSFVRLAPPPPLPPADVSTTGLPRPIFNSSIRSQVRR